ncbi:hypothetical protein RFI_30814 [Reticulomyxa filosa]|uniref:Uncharacterized protein n=1 Tax=Reticulomyxa filosa TaxID=46433 RepID=X6LY81_RETFI|nr:hypothetical protein RFI_30814 [Reticulomyxa filosa]|eukprot:ETO06579.1 hypothetical protein RFI_30814 [Reticulomyxa filosa]
MIAQLPPFEQWLRDILKIRSDETIHQIYCQADGVSVVTHNQIKKNSTIFQIMGDQKDIRINLLTVFYRSGCLNEVIKKYCNGYIIGESGTLYQCLDIESKLTLKKIDTVEHTQEKIVEIQSGWNHFLILTNYGHVYSWGLNLFHACGHIPESEKNENKTENIININSPTPIPCFLSPLIKVAQISCGIWHSVCVTALGDIYVFGLNKDGQLGLGKEIYHCTSPELLTCDFECAQISCGGRHTCAVDKNGNVWGWGYNAQGQALPSDHIDKKAITCQDNTHIWVPAKWDNIKAEKIVCGHWGTSVICLNNTKEKVIISCGNASNIKQN